jgi:hypothetical protein
MTKEDVATLTKVLRLHNQTADGPTEFTPDYLRILADFFASQVPDVNMKQWMDYIGGECGQSDESIFVESNSPHSTDSNGLSSSRNWLKRLTARRERV